MQMSITEYDAGLQVGSCEIKLCQVPVGSGAHSVDCNAVATAAKGILSGGQAHIPGSPSNIQVSVEQTDPSDKRHGDCESPSSTCKF